MDAADYYSGIVFDAYDKLKSSSFGAQPYASFVQTVGQPGLEIGCGDGEPMLTLCAQGLDVDGVDSSLDMVQRCRENAARMGLQVEGHHQRVEELSLRRRYASIYFAGPTFNLLPDDETALSALAAIRDPPTDGAMALIPLWIPDPTSDDELGVAREAQHDGGLLRYTPVSETCDPELRTRSTTTLYEKLTASGTEAVERNWIIHWHTPHSFAQICARADLEVVQVIDDETGEAASTSGVEFTATVRRS